ncbi:MAG TPA: hypothetical protein VG496_09940 [Myxococcales bacterium]|nr:hypothetical protein [Myxococcales bacterium]
MATCAACGTVILFGGKQIDEHRVCNDKCLARKRDELLLLNTVSDDDALERAELIHHSPCPRCGTTSRVVDVQVAYVTKAALVVHWTAAPAVLACHPCGNRLRWKSMLTCLLLGWWSQAGLFRTPIFVARNILAMFEGDGRPSERLLFEARMQIIRERQRQQNRPMKATA